MSATNKEKWHRVRSLSSISCLVGFAARNAPDKIGVLLGSAFDIALRQNFQQLWTEANTV
ncbi:MAG: hypothetical protein DWQ53_15760 [Microcystis flos-aquae DF17]|jgi:hypothetical protein|uniref:Uncharacterized protein n=2 Tax=Microcystis TaxID=1125 RepID=B0JKP7_MICAN|nr:MAG: hypothetical protein DWQ53_15760 [Microcystis flos-aquae DF17]BAG02836.1 unknown protein [Microcystis aeruginosa NIES-843]BBH38119.1 unknown protein [Microcystis viridis NIES-102]